MPDPLPQIYETTVVDPVTGIVYGFASVPTRSAAGVSTDDLISSLGLILRRPMQRPFGPSPLRHLVVETLTVQAIRVQEPRATLAFAQRLVSERLVPFEQSPQAPQSLAHILGSAVGGAAGLAIGYRLSVDPLLVITVPAGMVIGGTAAGLSEAMRIGLRYKLLKAMGVPDPWIPPGVEDLTLKELKELEEDADRRD